MSAPTAFKFKFRLQYCSYVENLLYNMSPFNVDLPEHSVQFKSSKRAMCLQCNMNLKLPLTDDKLAEHFKSEEHLLRCDPPAEEFYHKVFMEMDDKDQAIQIYFDPYNLSSLYCELCHEVVCGTRVRRHMCLNSHRVQMSENLDFWPLVKNAPENLPLELEEDSETGKEDFQVGSGGETVCNDINYADLSKDDLSVKHLRLISSKPNPFTFHMLEKSNICLVCQLEDESSIAKHVVSARHLKMISTDVHLNIVKHFHGFWKNEKCSVQKHRTQFATVGLKVVECLVCGCRVQYSRIIEHLKTVPNHGFNQEAHLPSVTNEPDGHMKTFIKEHCSFPMNYEEDTKMILYPEPLMKEVMKLDQFPIYTIQRQLENTQCLLCHEYMEGVIATQDILAHIQSEFHRSKATDAVNILALAAYHRFWSQQPVNIQVKQHKFRPHRELYVKCLNCKKKLRSGEIIPHLTVPCVPKRIATQLTNGNDKLGKLGVQRVKDNSIICDAQKVELPTKMETTPLDPIVNNPGPSGSKVEYDSATISKVYPNYNISKRQRRPTIYFMQKRSQVERYCLCCCKSVLGTPTEHLNGKKHQKNFENPEIIKLLNVYHQYWASQPPEVQLAQVNFNPWTCRLAQCNLCRIELPYNKIKTHPCLNIAAQCVEFQNCIPEAFQKVEIKYHSVTWKKFYSKSFMDVSKALLKTNMPLGQHWLGKIYCFLCPVKILRDLAFWNRHLMKHCLAKGTFTETKLQIILKYHRFWEAQPIELQVLQIHFIPKTLDTVLCMHRHTLNYSQVIEHTENCRIQNVEKLFNAVEKSKLEGEDNPNSVAPRPSKVREDIGDDVVIEEDHSSDSDVISLHNSTESLENCSPDNAPMEQAINSNGTKKKSQIFGKNGMVETAHEIIPSLPKDENLGILQAVPNRLKNHLKYLLTFDDKIKCSACNMIMRAHEGDLMNHLTHRDHLVRANLSLPRCTYICEICQQKAHNEVKWLHHLDSNKHKATFAGLGDIRRKILEEYECLSCSFVIYGDKLSLLRHQELFSIKKEKKNTSNVVLRVEVKRLFESAVIADRIADSLLQKSNEALEKDQSVKDCLEALEVAIGKQYPGCKAYPFGSRVTGIGKVESDLDVFMDVGNMYDGLNNQEPKQQQDIVLKVRKILVDDKNNFSDVLPITSARTPIVRVIHIGTDIDCDLSFRHGLSVENTKFISFCLDLQPITRPAMLLLKHWADIVSLKDEITSYALCMMFIFNLQLQGYLLSVQKLRRLTTLDVQTIDSWQTVTYNKPIEELKKEVNEYKGNVFEMIKDFFHMYTEFNFDIELICPLLGRTIMVDKFANNGMLLPKEMDTYKERIKTDPDCQFKATASMCVQDPFDLGHNLTKAVQKPFRKKFVSLCQITCDFMSAKV